MITVSFELTLYFPEETQAPTPARAVFEALGGKTSEGKPKPHEPSASMRDSKTKLAVSWDYKSCGIIQEDVDDVPKCILTFLAVLGKINKVVPIGKISCKRLRVYWILPTNKNDFKNLEIKYRQMFIKDNKLFSNCVDSTVVVDMKHNKWGLAHQSGAMNVAQLQNQFKVFDIREGQPEIFLFLSTTVNDDQLEKYLRKNIESFLNKSYEICKAHSDNFGEMMEEVL